MARKKTATLVEARLRSAQLDSELLATDARLNGSVLVVHQDGSFLFFRYAFAVTWKGWVIVLSEHHGSHLYPKDDLRNLRMFGPERAPEEG